MRLHWKRTEGIAMTEVKIANDRRYRRRLRQGRRMWNLASRADARANARLGPPLHKLALEQLGLREGEAVLDIGCGVGAMLERLREAVGPSGRVVGVDYSPRMVAAARKLVRDKGWTNVEVRQADAARESHGHQEFDAAMALASFSAMPDVATAVRLAHDGLRPCARLFVFDLRLVPSGNPWTRTMTRLLRGIYRLAAGFTGADVLAELTATFDSVRAVFPPVPGRTRLTVQVATKRPD
jgi:SAM-dependent methyltransferase